VVVDDEGGRRQAEAIAACYKLLPAVHRLFRRVAGEEDDYIASPKVCLTVLLRAALPRCAFVTAWWAVLCASAYALTPS
jgi:hypothetical protein